MAHRFVLRVTGGPAYDPSTHTTIPVNSQKPTKISNEHIDATVDVNIQGYRGLPHGSPNTSPYFSSPEHKADLYNISFNFTPKTSISGNDLVFGNDFDHPIRDRLPPGFSTAFNIVKWMIDPGLDGDPYADEPYLYGPLLSSINILEIGEKEREKEVENTEEDEDDILDEGAVGSGEEVRQQSGMPDDAKTRKKYYLTEANRKNFTFEEGREYKCDFFNPYLDFNEFSLCLPGFHINIIKYWDGQPLRYVLRNKATGDLLFVLVFTLVPAEEAAKEGEKAEQTPENGKAFFLTIHG
ncbi:DUF1769-domain-containing protein [Viridothelium virens]|uniref:DUF1769-domain-containing protein n=1 Tax=Viridothelium virens TaxID=1048519 RepID=A0A6A6GXL8_VIRVR|nr:DUF1769-domain-containing protein [Viridothelium virens]